MANKTISGLSPLSAFDAANNDVLVCSQYLSNETKNIRFDEYFKYAVDNLIAEGSGFSKTYDENERMFTFSGSAQSFLTDTLTTGNNWISHDGSFSGISLSPANALAISLAPRNYGVGEDKSHVVDMALTTWGKSYFSDTVNIGPVEVDGELFRANGKVDTYDRPVVIDHRGRLGINNDSPTEFLDVDGSANITGTLTVGGNIVTSGSGEILGVKWENLVDTPTTLEGLGITEDDPLLQSELRTDFIEPVTIEVNSIEPALKITQHGTGNAIEYDSNEFPYLFTNNGRVGINTIDPDVVKGMEIVGDLKVDGNFVITGATTGIDAGVAEFFNVKDTTNNAAYDSMHYLVFSNYLGEEEEIRGNYHLKFNPSSKNLDVYKITTDNNITVGTDLIVGGSVSISGNITGVYDISASHNVSINNDLSVGNQTTTNDLIVLNNINHVGLTGDRVVVSDASKNIISSGITTTELNRLSGVTDNVQTQLTSLSNTVSTKAPKENPSFTGTVYLPNNGFRFSSDGAQDTEDTGMYWGGDGYIAILNNGVYRGRFGPSGYEGNATTATTATKLSNSSNGSAPNYAARAWVNFNGNGGSIRSSGNVSSVSYYGSGYYGVNFATPMPNTNYAATATGIEGVGVTKMRSVSGPYAAYPTTTQFRFLTTDTGHARINYEYVTAAFFV